MPRLLAPLALLACSAEPSCREADGPRRVGVHAIWFEGVRDENSAEVHRFLECLVDGSNLESFWDGGLTLDYRGAWTLPAPDSPVAWRVLHEELDRQIDRGALPAPPPGETPLYVVISSHPAVSVGACGRSILTRVDGREAGIALVRNYPLCWPTGDRLRNETQTTLHEIAEVVDRLQGDSSCSPHGGCGGTESCPLGCDAFVGLSCPGAPEASWTGCAGGQVQGWVVQRLSRAGRTTKDCNACLECDFTPQACAPGVPGCP